MLLAAEHLEKNYGMKRLIQDASLYLDTGDKVGIIGVNGTGKSTLLRVLARAEEPDSGTVHVFPDVQVSYLPQNPDMDPDATVPRPEPRPKVPAGSASGCAIGA